MTSFDMEPKLKAKELVNKMYFDCTLITFEVAKKCALIAVDELYENTVSKLDADYYQEIKKEIENL